MSAMQQSEPLKSQTDIPPDKIELIDLLRVIWKWKYLIIGGTFVFGLVAAIISLTMPQIYSVDMIIEPGILSIINEGGEKDRRIYIESPQSIKALIDVGSFGSNILESLGKQSKNNDLPKTVEFKTSIQEQSNAVKVSYETANAKLGQKILTHLIDLLLIKYSQIIQHYQKDFYSKIKQKKATLSKISANILKVKNEISAAQSKIDSTVKLKRNKIESVKSSIEAKKIQIANVRNWIKDVQIENDRITKNTDFLIEERNKLLARKKEGGDDLSSVVYINTIQQNIAYSNNLKNQINNVNNQIVRNQAEIEKLENEIRDLEIQIEDLTKQTSFQISTLKSQIDDLESQKDFTSEEINILEYRKDNVQNIQILKPPTNNPNPIKPSKRRNVLLATTVGLFMMLFASFFIEYIKKNRK